jgi:hypothetical protein
VGELPSSSRPPKYPHPSWDQFNLAVNAEGDFSKTLKRPCRDRTVGVDPRPSGERPPQYLKRRTGSDARAPTRKSRAIFLLWVQIQAQLGEGHISIVNAKEAVLTEKHLALVMEYAAGGSLTAYVSQRWQHATHTGLFLGEDEARYFFRVPPPPFDRGSTPSPSDPNRVLADVWLTFSHDICRSRYPGVGSKRGHRKSLKICITGCNADR